jgi:hypothetical protein
MSDHSLPACVTEVFGCSGSGKTTLVYRYLLNRATPQPLNENPAACIFIFDWKLEAERRLGIPAVTTAHGCENALAGRWVVFNPHPSFPGDKRVKNPEGEWVMNDERMALRWFCKWVFEVSQRGPGKKVLYIDELKNFASKFYVPPEIDRIARMGRAENLELVLSTQYPRDYHADLRSAVTEWICFKTTEPAELDAVRPYFPGVDKVATLNKGQFIGYNRDNGEELAGKVF